MTRTVHYIFLYLSSCSAFAVIKKLKSKSKVKAEESDPDDAEIDDLEELTDFSPDGDAPIATCDPSGRMH